LVARYPAIIEAALPGSSRRWIRALTEGSPPPREAGFVWYDASAGRLTERRRATIAP
jgi:hypothetical protein